jgi:F-type H+-transporting ATPase subunit delta
MTSPAIVNRYAGALVDVVLGPRGGIQPPEAIAQLRSFEAAVTGSPALRTILASPAVPRARKRTVLRRIAEALGLSRMITNFLLVLSDRGRAGALSETIHAFEQLVDERLGFVHAEVRSAYALTSTQQQALSAELSRLAGKQVRMKFVSDPDLIGGVTARLGSKLYDGSVRGRLAKMRDSLTTSG